MKNNQNNNSNSINNTTMEFVNIKKTTYNINFIDRIEESRKQPKAEKTVQITSNNIREYKISLENKKIVRIIHIDSFIANPKTPR